MFPVGNVLRRLSFILNFQLGSIRGFFVPSGFLELGTKTSRDGKPLPVRPYLLWIVGQKENLIRDYSCEVFLPQEFYATQTADESCYHSNSSNEKIMVWPEFFKKSLTEPKNIPKKYQGLLVWQSSHIICGGWLRSAGDSGLCSNTCSGTGELLEKFGLAHGW